MKRENLDKAIGLDKDIKELERKLKDLEDYQVRTVRIHGDRDCLGSVQVFDSSTDIAKELAINFIERLKETYKLEIKKLTKQMEYL